MAATRYSDGDSRETDLAAATAAIISAHWGSAASRASGTSNGRPAGGRAETEQRSTSYSPTPSYSPNGDAGYGDAGYGNTAYSDTGYSDTGYSDTGYGDTEYGDTGYGDTGYGDTGYGDTGYGDKGYGDKGYGDPGYGDDHHYGRERGAPEQTRPEQNGAQRHPNGYAAGRSYETPSVFLPAPPPDLAPPDFLISAPLPGQRTGSTADTAPSRAQAAAAAVDETFAGSVVADLPFPQMPFADTSFPFPDSRWDGEANDGPLPHRIPAAPDVPPVPPPAHDPLHDPLEDMAAGEVADRGELSRIMTYLRDHAQAPSGKGFDVAAVLEAVRGVANVRDAQLRWSAGFGHTLRIEFQEGTDESYVTREVVRVLRDTLGLNAAPRPAGREESTSDRSTAARPPGAPTAYSTVPYATVPFGYGPRAGYGITPAATAGPVSPAPLPAPMPVPMSPPRPSRVPVGGLASARPGEPRPLPPHGIDDADPGWISLDHVQVSVLGMDATVEVRLGVSIGQLAGSYVVGVSHGPAVDAYLLRLAASAAADALDRMLVDPVSGDPRGRCFVEHVGVVPFGDTEVAVVVLLLVRGSVAETLSGSALVGRDPRQAVVQAMLRAVNPRLESLLVS